MSYRDFYTDEESGVLKNLNGIKDEKKLEKIERAFSQEKANYPVKDFDVSFDGFKAVHKHLFGEVYEWAGQSRGQSVVLDGKKHHPDLESVISKGTSVFAKTAFLESETPKYFMKLKASLDKLFNEKELSSDKFSSLVSEHMGDLNHAHPFREGNGRTMRVYMEHLAREYDFNLPARSFDKDRWMEGSIKAMEGDIKPLKALILDHLEVSKDKGQEQGEKSLTISMEKAGQNLAKTMGLTYKKLELQEPVEVIYEGYINLEKGTFMALKQGKELSLLKVMQKPDIEKGMVLNVTPSKEPGRFKIEAVRNQQIQQQNSKELER